MSDDLLAAAEWVRVETSLALSADAQSSRGQYFTPARAASLIAAMSRIPDADPIRILDPGAGSGILTAAPGRHIEVTAVEIDPTLIPALQRTAELCRRCGDAEISINVIQGDIINLAPKLNSIFHLIIINPPYKKLGALSPVRHTLVYLIWDAPICIPHSYRSVLRR